jgi:hypothetical protein
MGDELHEKTRVTGVGCMAHARRKFMDIVKGCIKDTNATDLIFRLCPLDCVNSDKL